MPNGLPLNLGDALLTRSLEGRLREAGADVRIADFGGVARSPADGTHVPLEGVRGLWRALGKVDAVVIGGGTLLQDDNQGGSPWGGLPRLVLVTALLARVRGLRVAFFGVGSNLTRRAIPRRMLRIALSLGPAWVRDDFSQGLVQSQFHTSARLAADTALFLRPAPTATSSGELLVIAAYARDLTMLNRPLLETLRTQFREVVFVSMHQGRPNDGTGLSAEARSLIDRTYADLTLKETIELFSSASAVLSSRMHALYLGALLGRPLMAFSRRPKVCSFAHEYSVPRTDDLSSANAEHGLEFAEVSAAALEQARMRLEDVMIDLLSYVRATEVTEHATVPNSAIRNRRAHGRRSRA